MHRHGYYVNGRQFGLEQRAQAIARSEFLASEQGRDITVHARDHAGRESVLHVAKVSSSMSTSLLVVF